MQESKLREVIGQSLPKILTSTAKGIYSLEFQARAISPDSFRLDVPIAASQLAYTPNWQALSFILMDPGHILKLGLRAFPKKPRPDIPKTVISANSELLNLAASRLGFILGKLDNTQEVCLTPPLAMNFTGGNALEVSCRDSIFLRLVSEEGELTFITSLQMA